jgi:3-hydroxybutyryl-CoA dehydrogenase
MVEIRKVGVIGAGQMGNGIAQVCAAAGLQVALNDLSDDRIKAGIATIEGNLARQVEKNKIDDLKRRETLALISPAAEFSAFGDCDLIIEAASENEEIKRNIFIKLIPSLKPGAMLASNTSSISITRLASVTDRPDHRYSFHESGATDAAG